MIQLKSGPTNPSSGVSSASPPVKASILEGLFWPDILKVDFLAPSKPYFLIFWASKCERRKKSIKDIKGVKTCGKKCKNGKSIWFLVWVYTSQDFAQNQQNFAPPHNGETVIFRNSGSDKPSSALAICCPLFQLDVLSTFQADKPLASLRRREYHGHGLSEGSVRLDLHLVHDFQTDDFWWRQQYWYLLQDIVVWTVPSSRSTRKCQCSLLWRAAHHY